jgi:hypothetical protein
MKAAEKIIDALTQLLEGYAELQESLEADFGASGAEEEDETSAELDAALVTEVRSALESVIENEDFSAEEVASVISAFTDALQEIDPDVFEEEKDEDEDEEDDNDDDDYDDDDVDYDEDEDEDEK